MVKFLRKAKDGGPDSPVTGYWLIEAKSLFSVVLLRFDPGLREAFHSHAFNALTWVIKGKMIEHTVNASVNEFTPSLKAKKTPRSCVHRVQCDEQTWAISLRGPWTKTWYELRGKNKQKVVLGHGRVVQT